MQQTSQLSELSRQQLNIQRVQKHIITNEVISHNDSCDNQSQMIREQDKDYDPKQQNEQAQWQNSQQYKNAKHFFNLNKIKIISITFIFIFIAISIYKFQKEQAARMQQIRIYKNGPITAQQRAIFKDQPIYSYQNYPKELYPLIDALYQQEIQHYKKKRQNQTVYNGSDLIIPSVKFNPQYKYDLSRFANPARIVDLKYQDSEYFTLPIDPLRKNQKGETIQYVLYGEKRRQDRIKFIQVQNKRMKKFSKVMQSDQTRLIQFNAPLDQEVQKRAILQNKKDWVRLNQKYNISSVTTQLPICVISNGRNDDVGSISQRYLNSVFTQNYTNFKVVLIDDASSDGTVQLYKKYFRHHKIDKKHYTLISNGQRIAVVANLLFGTINYCSIDSIVIVADPDDQLIGRNIFQVFNWAYQAKKVGVVSSSHIQWVHRSDIYRVFKSEQINQHFRVQKTLREKAVLGFYHLRSYRASLMYQIPPSYFQHNSNGKFMQVKSDVISFLAMLQRSCGSQYILKDQYFYLWNALTGKDGAQLYPSIRRKVNVSIRQKKPLECNKTIVQNWAK